jgi:hypothetical protein
VTAEERPPVPCEGCGGAIERPGHGRRFCEVCSPPLQGRVRNPLTCQNRVPGAGGPWAACGAPTVPGRSTCEACAGRLAALAAMLSPHGGGGRS